MRVFKPTYKDENGVKRRTNHWYLDFLDHLGIRQRVVGLVDRKLTESLGRNIEKVIQYRVTGEPLDTALAR